MLPMTFDNDCTRLLSIVVPCYNEEESLPAFFDAIERAMEQVRSTYCDVVFELILIDDGSSDRTVGIIQGYASAMDSMPVRWKSFSRNFGKEAALMAGLECAHGKFVAVMDADLQDPPELLVQMLGPIISNECDCVAARRVTRTGEPPIRSFLSRAFYRLINAISDTEFVDGARDFRLMSRRMVDAVLSLPERVRFSKGIFSWVGFETRWISYENRERVCGSSDWSLLKLLTYSIDGIVAFTTLPLSIASACGVLLCAAALIAIIFIVIRALLFGDPVAGWPSLACIIIFLGGLQLLCLGILGQYLAKTYEEAKGRPLYVIKDEGDNTKRAESPRMEY